MKKLTVLIVCVAFAAVGCIEDHWGGHVFVSDPEVEIPYHGGWGDWPNFDSLLYLIQFGTLNSAIWADSTFVIVGHKIIASNDGSVFTVADWNAENALVSPLTAVVRHSGRFVAFQSPSRILVSDSLPVWTTSQVTIDSLVWNRVACSNDGCVAIATSPSRGKRLLYSPDGIAWDEGSQAMNLSLNDLIWDGHQFLISADTIVLVSDSSGESRYERGSGVILSSTDGLTWESRPTGRRLGFELLTWSEGLYAAVVQNDSIPLFRDVMTSPDGITWTTIYTASNCLSAIATDGATVVVAYSQGAFGLERVSGDGSNTSAGFTYERVEDIVYGNGMFLAVARGVIATSADGLEWTVKWP